MLSFEHIEMAANRRQRSVKLDVHSTAVILANDTIREYRKFNF